jgi:hypothetical protein
MPQVQKKTQATNIGEGQAGKYRELVESMSATLDQLEDLQEDLSDPSNTDVVTPTQWANLQGKLMAITGAVREINMARLASGKRE